MVAEREEKTKKKKKKDENDKKEEKDDFEKVVEEEEEEGDDEDEKEGEEQPQIYLIKLIYFLHALGWGKGGGRGVEKGGVRKRCVGRGGRSAKAYIPASCTGLSVLASRHNGDPTLAAQLTNGSGLHEAGKLKRLLIN